MKLIYTASIPNQELTFPINGERWLLRLFTAGPVLCADVYLNDEIVVLGARVVPGEPIIRYNAGEYGGNFYLATEADEYPHWKSLGGKHILVYTND